MIRFPETLNAFREGEKNSWRIADALLREVDPAKGRTLRDVAKELTEYAGLHYRIPYLKNLMLTAKAFTPNERHVSLSFAVHMEAGNPQVLDAIVGSARAKNIQVTTQYVRTALSGIKEQERLVRQHARTQAREAAAQSIAAFRRMKTVTDPETLQQLQSEGEQAKRRQEIANELAHQSPASRKRPDPATIDAMVVQAGAMKVAFQAQRQAQLTRKSLEEGIGMLSDTAIEGFVEAALSAANAWNDVAAFARGATGKKRHLYVVNE